MKQQGTSTGGKSRALTKKAPLDIVAMGNGESTPAESVKTPASDESIRQAAYSFYEARGCVDGHDLDDWLRAEAQVTGARSGAMAGRPSH